MNTITKTISLKDTLTAMAEKKYPVIPVKGKMFAWEFGKKWGEVNNSWTPYYFTPPSPTEINNWVKKCDGIALLMRHYECIDFDNKIDDLDEIFGNVKDIISNTQPGLWDQLYIESTPSGGYHIIYGVNDTYKTSHIAQRKVKNDIVTFIETKSDSGYVVVAPSKGYETIQGDITNLPEITADERELIISVCLSMNEEVHEDTENSYKMTQLNGSAKPGELYNRSGNISDLLSRHGWQRDKIRSTNEYWTRPGKDKGVSGCWNGKYFYVFTAGAYPLLQAHAYNLFFLRATLEHGGDASKCAKKLYSEGFVDKNAPISSFANGYVEDDTYSNKDPKQKSKSKIEGSDSSFVAIEDLEVAVKALATTRYNCVKGRVEICDHSSWQIMDDRAVFSLWRNIRTSMFSKISKTYIQDVIDSDFSPTYHPFLEFFRNLPEWDGVDHIQNTADCVTVDPADIEKWHNYFKRWMIALVACATKNKANHSCIVLQGGQGIGKTTFVERLIPEGLEEYLVKAQFNPNDKDAKIMVAESLIINLDELESSTRDEVGVLKSLITTESVTVRRPYARRAETLKRTASFIGSVNNTNFLTDNTGTRRFLVVEALSVDNTKAINTTQLYAQAQALFNRGDKYWFDNKEIEEINKHNEQFAMQQPEEEALVKVFKPYTFDSKHPDVLELRKLADAYNTIILLTTTEIIHELKKTFEKMTIYPIRFSIILKKHGFKSINMRYRGRNARFYPVMKVDPNEIIDKKEEDEEIVW